MKLCVNLIITVSFLLILIPSSKATEVKIIKIGTGNKNALAYPTVSKLCKFFNSKNYHKEFKCQAIETGGSNDNLRGIMSGKFDAGVIKADMGYNVYNGIGIFANKPYRKLRNIIGLHNEYLTILVKKNSNITTWKEFKNKRVYIGNNGSGSRIIVDKLIAKSGWQHSDFKEIHEEQPNKIYDLFCKNKIDAAIYLVGHPNSIFEKTLKECQVKIISFSRKEIENYVDIFRHIYPATIIRKTYANQNSRIQTIAAQLLLVTSTKLDEKFVYDFAKTISEHNNEIETQIQNLKGVSLFNTNINVIPLHKGVTRLQHN